MKKLLLLTFALLLFSCELDQEVAQAEIIDNIPIVEFEPEPIPETIPETETIIDDTVYTTRFIINRNWAFREETGGTRVTLDFPILTRDSVEYNIETMASDVNGLPVKTTYSDTERLVYIDMDIEKDNNFIFRTDYNMNLILGFTLAELDTTNMGLLLEYVNYIPPEEMIPDFDTVLFNLTGTVGTMDSFKLTSYSYLINGVETTFINATGVQVGTVKTIPIHINVGDKDDFLLRNMYEFFRFDFNDMTIEELTKAIDILERYPEEDLWDLVREYDPTNPGLE